MAAVTGKRMDMDLLVEAALFSAGHPVSVAELAETTGASQTGIRSALKRLVSAYDERNTALQVARVGSKYAMQVKPDLSEPVKMLGRPQIPKRLLKTAALIAYHQPVLQSDLVEMAGLKVYDHVRELTELRMVSASPKGHSKELKITKKFIEAFGIESSRRADIKLIMSKKAGIKDE